jgi:hypothetical protein
MRIEIEVTGKPFQLSEFYKEIKTYLKGKANINKLKISIERK